jgi:hypothetical protein
VAPSPPPICHRHHSATPAEALFANAASCRLRTDAKICLRTPRLAERTAQTPSLHLRRRCSLPPCQSYPCRRPSAYGDGPEHAQTPQAVSLSKRQTKRMRLRQTARRGFDGACRGEQQRRWHALWRCVYGAGMRAASLTCMELRIRVVSSWLRQHGIRTYTPFQQRDCAPIRRGFVGTCMHCGARSLECARGVAVKHCSKG